jgi:hypothetical protein
MNPHASSAAAHRLQRLTDYLAEDPTNASLLAEACDTAITCGRHELAEEFIAAARQLSINGTEWTFRRARLCIARRQLAEAGVLLEQLRGEAGDHAVLAHDAAYVRLLQGDPDGAGTLLQPWVDKLAVSPEVPREQREALQVLWVAGGPQAGPARDCVGLGAGGARRGQAATGGQRRGQLEREMPIASVEEPKPLRVLTMPVADLPPEYVAAVMQGAKVRLSALKAQSRGL